MYYLRLPLSVKKTEVEIGTDSVRLTHLGDPISMQTILSKKVPNAGILNSWSVELSVNGKSEQCPLTTTRPQGDACLYLEFTDHKTTPWIRLTHGREPLIVTVEGFRLYDRARPGQETAIDTQFDCQFANS